MNQPFANIPGVRYPAPKPAPIHQPAPVGSSGMFDTL